MYSTVCKERVFLFAIFSSFQKSLHSEHQSALEEVERREEREAEERAEAHELDLFRLKDEYLARTFNLRTRIETLEQQLEKCVLCYLLPILILRSASTIF